MTSQRNQLIQDKASAKRRREVLGAIDDGLDQFDLATRREAESLGDTELRAETLSAIDQWMKTGGEHAKHRAKIFRETFGERVSWLLATNQTADDRLQQLIPSELAEAIRMMEGELELCRKLGCVERTFSSLPGGETFLSPRNRTPAHEALTVRCEQELGRLRGLYATPDEELPAAIKEILSGFAKAKLAVINEPHKSPARVTAAPVAGLVRENVAMQPINESIQYAEIEAG